MFYEDYNFNEDMKRDGFKRAGHRVKYDFFSHCQACDERLNGSYTKDGFCGDCRRVINRSKVPDLVKIDNDYTYYEMWRNPMGSVDEDIFVDDLEDYYD